jgi:hypothetical protein
LELENGAAGEAVQCQSLFAALRRNRLVKRDSLSKAKKEFKTEQTDENSTGGYDDGGESDSDDTVAAAFADHDFERMLHEMDPEDFSEWDMGVILNECLEVLEIMDAEDTDSTEFIPAKHFDLSHPMISGRNRGSGEGAASTPFAQTAHAGSSNHWSAQDLLSKLKNK